MDRNAAFSSLQSRLAQRRASQAAYDSRPRGPQGVLGGTPVARQVSGMLGQSLMADPPQSVPASPVSVPSLRGPSVIPSYQPKPAMMGLGEPASAYSLMQHQPQGAFPPASAMSPQNSPMPSLQPSGLVSPQEHARGVMFQQIRQNLLNREGADRAKLQAFEQGYANQNKQTGLENLRPQHFGGAYGDSLVSGATDRNREAADSALYGGGIQPSADPRFAAMTRFMGNQPITPHPGEPTPLSTRDLESRNGFGLNRGPGEMNLRSRLTDSEAANITNGDLGTYGQGGSLVRRDGQNTLIGQGYSQNPQDANYSRWATPEGKAELAAGRQKFLADKASAKEQRALQQAMARGGRGVPARTVSATDTVAPTTSGPVPFDTAVQNIAKTQSAPWAMYGISDFTSATPQSLYSALTSPEFQGSSPATKQQRLSEARNFLSLPQYQNDPHMNALRELLTSGSLRSAEKKTPSSQKWRNIQEAPLF